MTTQRISSHPHYFSMFQSYCTEQNISNKDVLLLNEQLKHEIKEVLHNINQEIIKKLVNLTLHTTCIPIEFVQDCDTPTGNIYQHYLIDQTMYKLLNDSKIINFIPQLQKLYPVRTSGNGNCLLHACLIAIAGVHDFNLYLRDCLTQFMDVHEQSLKKRWQIERLKNDQKLGITTEDNRLDTEWKELCDLVRYENKGDGTIKNLQFLEAVHIFSIANMFCRPIIVLSEHVVRNKHGEAISINDIMGIYLPILSSQNNCTKDPIVIAYDKSHFCPLLTCDAERWYVSNGKKYTAEKLLPLLQYDDTSGYIALPVHFLDNSEQSKKDNLLKQYLKLTKTTVKHETSSQTIPCCQLGGKRLPQQCDFILLYKKYVLEFIEEQKRLAEGEHENRYNSDGYGEFISPFETYRNEDLPPPYNSKQSTTSMYSDSLPKQQSTTNSMSGTNFYSTNIFDNQAGIQSSLHEHRESYENAVVNGQISTAPSSINGYPYPYDLQDRSSPYSTTTQKKLNHQTDNYINNQNDNYYDSGKQETLVSSSSLLNIDENHMHQNNTTIDNLTSDMSNSSTKESKLKKGM
ncbi:unnamed protein product [Didymodactylos carnosus]|uniref:OTU domain-containing protein n=1 Tax=Didymodactylos carnosus TaxID=1234261 RepID=A0A813TSU2_9BILA|nr:unnamed protein product [Didymodactylos carnosus]CAF1079994.1 unnamed protein product [Didymodactylos carnosus]CAF3605113.1 unnamed protein product [Didymodactylos carnosus]CAF3843141.1 unnamed protein product [Didymodactylos carnosus]